MRRAIIWLGQNVSKPLGWALVATLIGAFALVLMQASSTGRSRPLTKGIGGESTPTATVPQSLQHSPPTPTPVTNLPGGPVPTANNNGPLSVVSLSVASYGSDQPQQPIQCVQYVNTELNAEGWTPPTITLAGYVYVDQPYSRWNVAYRWRFSDGAVTDQFTSAQADDYTSPRAKPILVTYPYTYPLSYATGAPIQFQLEVLAPTPMISAPATFYPVNCVRIAYGGATFSDLGNYRCDVGGTQTYQQSGLMAFTLDPRPGTAVYHWLRPDGSTSPTYTAAIGPGVTRVDANGDSFTVAASDPNGQYSDRLVITAPYGEPGLTFSTANVVKSC